MQFFLKGDATNIQSFLFSHTKIPWLTIDVQSASVSPATEPIIKNEMSTDSASSKWSCHAPYFSPAVIALPSEPALNDEFSGVEGLKNAVVAETKCVLCSLAVVTIAVE